MKSKKICPSCTAEYSDTLPKCPYCGTLNIKGAQAEYLNKLESVRRDLEELEEVPLQETRKEAVRQGQFLKKILLVLGVLAVLFAGLMAWSNRPLKENRLEEYKWKQEMFPVFDELYENGDYDVLVEAYWEALDQGMPFWDWQHSGDFEEYIEKLLDEQD